MPNVKATWFFVDDEYGWSESLWQTGDAKTLQAVLEDAIDYAKARLALCGTGPGLPYIRVSDESIRGDSLVKIVNMTTILSAVPPGAAEGKKDSSQFIRPAILNANIASTTADVPYSSLLIRSQAGSLYRRMSYMRGIPDDVIIDEVGPILYKVWNDAFQAWKKLVIATGWTFKALSKSQNLAPHKPITAILAAPPGAAVVSIPAHGLAQFQKTRIAGCKGTNVPSNGIYTVIKVVDGDSVWLQGYSPTSVTYVGGGTSTAQVTTYQGIDDIQVRGMTHRSTGRPFDSPRGRRRVRR